MTSFKNTFSLKFRVLSLCFISASLGASEARAQSYLSPGYIMGEIRNGLGVESMPVAPDFVSKARPDPATLEYVPLKPPPKNFHSEANTPARRIEAEAGTIAELEAARAATQARANSASPAKPGSKAAAAPPEEDPAPMKWNAWDTQ